MHGLDLKKEQKIKKIISKNKYNLLLDGFILIAILLTSFSSTNYYLPISLAFVFVLRMIRSTVNHIVSKPNKNCDVCGNKLTEEDRRLTKEDKQDV